MGTLVRITVYTNGEDEARRAFRAGFARIGELDAILSDYNPDSELSRVTAIAAGAPAPVSRDLYAVLEAAQQLAEATAGAFDVTQGPVIRLWREARRSSRCLTRMRCVRLPAAPVTESCTWIEFAGPSAWISKTWPSMPAALRRATPRARHWPRSPAAVCARRWSRSAATWRSAMRHRAARGWRISVHDLPGEQAVPQVLELANAAVSTAGAAEQHLDAGGLRYSHIVDPSTRMGLTEDLTVTVVARNGLVADGLDTAMSVLGVERGLALIERRQDAVALLIRKVASAVEVLPSSRFQSFTRCSAPLTSFGAICEVRKGTR